MKKYALTLLSVVALAQLHAQLRDEQLIQREMKTLAALRTYDTYSVASTNYDVNFYRCDWTVDPAVNFIAGSVTTYFTILSSSSNIIFDLHNSLKVDSVLYRGNKINFSQTSNHALQINFPANLSAAQKDSVSVFYKGAPANVGFGSFNIATHNNVPALWTLSEPYGAPSWWPCKDVLTDKPDSIDIIVRNPAAYVSSSNGLPVNEFVSGTTRVTYWKHRYPIAPYLIAIAVSNYNIDNDAVQLPGRTMPVVMYAYPENAAAFKAATNTAKFCLQNFPPLITEYPFIKERYAQTQFLWGGGMEHQTNSFIVNAGSGLVAHELAHQWFGDKVTTGSWQDLWLNEGFATYMEYIYTELTAPSAKLAQLQSWRDNITSSAGGSVFVPDTNNINRLFDSRLTYRKGGYLLHMLRWKLGDSTFFRAVRRYINDPALVYRNARTADLQRNFEAESGQNLAEFFKDWYYGEGYPNYSATWSQQFNNVVQLQLNQTTSHASVDFYEMPVPILFRSATRDTIITVNHTSASQNFSFNVGFAADTAIIDPQLWILSKTKTTKKIIVSSPQLMVYPNPATGAFTFTYPSNIGKASLQVFNSVGQLVYSANPATGSLIHTAGWAPGVYWIRITGNNFNQTKKFLIIRQ